MSKVQVIRDARNEPAFAVVPWAEYQKLTTGGEDAALIARGRAARGDETFPAAVARRLVAGEHPLKVIREWRGLVQVQLGKLAHVPAQYISQIESGRRNMGRQTAMRLARVLKVSLEALLGE
jgi:DNA-binding XRE family transcriptional regulator